MRIRLFAAAAIARRRTRARRREPGGEAQKPPKPGATTLKASAGQVTFSTPVALTGKVKGGKPGIAVTLERRAADATAFAPAGTRDDRCQR